MDGPWFDNGGVIQADADGRFRIDRVMAGDLRVARVNAEEPGTPGFWYGTVVRLTPGEEARVEVGGMGRPVVARIEPPDGFDPKANYRLHSEFTIASNRPVVPDPPANVDRSNNSVRAWTTAFLASAEGLAYRRDWFSASQIKLMPDGTIRLDDVPAGDFKLALTFSADPIYGLTVAPERVAFATRTFTIPPIPGGRSDEPFDLGLIEPVPGRKAPAAK